MITKETKTGVKEVNIRPGIYEMRILQDADAAESLNTPAIYILVDASSAGNLKPGKVIEAFLAANGEEMKENALLITREDVYTNIGTQEAPKLVPLDEIGSDIPENCAEDASEA